MSRRKTVWRAAILLAVLGIGLGSSTRADESSEQPAVQQAVENFYKALNTLFTGDVAPMTEVWSHADDVTYMGPTGGHQTGWKELEQLWKQQADKKLGGKIAYESIRLTVGDRLAVAVGVEAGFNVVDGKRQDVSIRSTSVLRKEGGAWKMICHHTDVLPFLSN